MSMPEPRETTPADLCRMIALAEAVAAGKSLRLPIGVQINALAALSLHLRDLLEGALDGAPAAIGVAREILGMLGEPS